MSPNLSTVVAVQFPAGMQSFPLSNPALPRGTPPLIPYFPGGIVPSTSQAATMTNGNPQIVVPNASAFYLYQPVQFTASANGFTVNTTYVVAQVGANFITVAAGLNAAGNGTTGVLNATGTAPANVALYWQPQSGVALVDVSQVPLALLQAAGFTGAAGVFANLYPSSYAAFPFPSWVQPFPVVAS